MFGTKLKQLLCGQALSISACLIKWSFENSLKIHVLELCANQSFRPSLPLKGLTVWNIQDLTSQMMSGISKMYLISFWATMYQLQHPWSNLSDFFPPKSIIQPGLKEWKLFHVLSRRETASYEQTDTDKWTDRGDYKTHRLLWSMVNNEKMSQAW